MIKPVFLNVWLQTRCWRCSHWQCIIANALLPICCRIGLGMPYLRIFVDDIVARYLGALTYKSRAEPERNHAQIQKVLPEGSNFDSSFLS